MCGAILFFPSCRKSGTVGVQNSIYNNTNEIQHVNIHGIWIKNCSPSEFAAKDSVILVDNASEAEEILSKIHFTEIEDTEMIRIFDGVDFSSHQLLMAFPTKPCESVTVSMNSRIVTITEKKMMDSASNGSWTVVFVEIDRVFTKDDVLSVRYQ